MVDLINLDKEKKINIKEVNILSLAYLGDSIWEVLIRELLVDKGYKVNKLNVQALNYVTAKKQSEILKTIESNLKEEYRDIVRRGRNSNIRSYPKTCTIEEYRDATALEALVGAIYLTNGLEGLKKIIVELIKGES